MAAMAATSDAFSTVSSSSSVAFRRGACATTPVSRSSSSSSSSVLLKMAAFESVEEYEMDGEERMGKSVGSVVQNLSSIRTGRANAAILDRVSMDYYGAQTPLNQMASISVTSAQQLTIDPYDKSVSADIERALMESDLGLTPTSDGNVIRINIPPLTEDRRKELLKQCKGIGEEGKVAIRNVRRDGIDGIKKLEKASTISKDQAKDGLDALQKLTDSNIKEIDGIVANKEKEVMKV